MCLTGFDPANFTTSFVNPGLYTATYSVTGSSLQVTFVPEPGTWAMALSGLGVLVCIRCSRRRRA